MPFFNLFKAVLVSDIVDNQSAFTIPVVADIKSVISFLARCVPNRKPYLRLIVDHHIFRVVGCIDSGLLLVTEFIFAILKCD